MKNPVKVARITNDTNKLQNAINSLDALVEIVEPLKKLEKRIIEPVTKKAEKVKEEKKPIIQSYKQQLEDNKKYKSLLDEECRKLGYALSLMKKFEKAFSPAVVSYIERIQSENVLFKLCEVNCPRTKSGNYSVWLLQSYIRKCLNA